MIRALLAKTLDNELHVLATDSEELAHDCDVCSTADTDLGLLDPKDKPAGPGLFLWTGTSKVEGQPPWDEPTVIYDGTCRPVLADELMELLSMTPPEPEEPPC